MRRSPKIILTALFLAGIAMQVGSQPIAPTGDLKSQAADAPATPVVDLPYKPDVVAQPPVTQEDPETQETEDATVSDVSQDKPVFDWASLPYIPLKMPALKNLPDPDF